jgi:putative ABC transport system permease protein
MGWQFAAGRDFSKEYSSDSSALVLNEAAIKFMGLTNPVGTNIKWGDENYQIIGVIKNMVMQSPYDPVDPIVYSLKNEKPAFVFIKINHFVNTGEALQKIQDVFQKYVPSFPFDYQFVDENFSKKFSVEERISKLSSFFTVLAIFISCLGLLGIASFIAEQRTKEIGIRKVLGASVMNVWQLLTKEFVLLIFISLLIASPLAWYFMHSWLQNYQYRIIISWSIFAYAALGALLITLIVVSFQVVKAAVANPVKSLRNE